MNRNKKGVMPEITREMYKAIKKYDRQQFAKFCTDLYTFGYEDGRESVPGVELKDVYEVIASTKGIGAKKLEDIKARLEPLFKEGEDDRSDRAGEENPLSRSASRKQRQQQKAGL